MSGQEKPRPPHKPELRNILTNPGKKGTYGYVDITFNKFPKSMLVAALILTGFLL